MRDELIEQMREAIDNMDDYARMADIKATGPLVVLSRGADALELADKRIAELEAELERARKTAMFLRSERPMARRLTEAERRIAVLMSQLEQLGE